ncbi:GNAT family N-acetyltransferase [Robiginitalea sediminis]|uniref:GNAT family N-acetyltransferase n=1 Tax=Robiginitalea sediminis TaxID=1982593 RepID=UPI000B4A86FC|nr:GNAT family N-acetyltransferase [Robiginitalea sediminis]
MYSPEDNPFLTETFTRIWSQHFSPTRPPVPVNALPGLTQVAHPRLPLMQSTGTTHTKGMCHGPVPENAELSVSKPVLVYDVPEFFNVPLPDSGHSQIGVKRVRQYPGFLIELTGLQDLNAYLQRQFSKSSRYKLKKYRTRLETAFDIRYVMYDGSVDETQYALLFDQFRALLEKRFDDKQVSNNNLEQQEWEFYKASTLPLMQEGRAGLFVVYSGDDPIAVTLNYFFNRTVLDAITVFDIDYGKFHLGSVSVMALIEWCLENNMDVLDFSKGYFDYKSRWATRQYDFEYRVYYPKGSFPGRLLARLTSGYFRGKQWLREKGWNDRLHKLTYALSSRKGSMPKVAFEWLDSEGADRPEVLQALTKVEGLYMAVLPAVFEFLYLEQESMADIRVLPLANQPEKFLIQGKKNSKVFRLIRK